MSEFNLFDKMESVPQGTSLSRSKQLLRIIEGFLFASSAPLSIAKMKEVLSSNLPVTKREIQALIEVLNQEYQQQGRAFQIDFIEGGYLMRTTPEVASYVSQLHKERKLPLSQAATEILAIIAHKQPITRAEIEGIRGVDSSGTLVSLMERNLIEVVGKRDAPGRPSLYGVTPYFLNHFGLRSLRELLSAECRDSCGHPETEASTQEEHG